MTVGKCKALCVWGVQRERKSEQERTPGRTRTVVPSDKGVTVLIGLLTVDVFLCLFECNVHVAVEATEDACGMGGPGFIERAGQRSWSEARDQAKEGNDVPL